MRAEDNSIELGKQTTSEDGATMMVCRSCEQLVPAGSPYCPYCCGEDGRRGAIKRGAFIGGVFGLLAGGLSAAVWSSIVGPEQAGGELVMTITLVGAAIGVLIGVVQNRRR